MAAAWSVDHLEDLVAYWEKDSFVNVNIPNNPAGPDGFVLTWPAVKSYQDTIKMITAPDGSPWCFLDSGEQLIIKEAGSDCDVVSKNLVSVSSVYNYPVASGKKE